MFIKILLILIVSVVSVQILHSLKQRKIRIEKRSSLSSLAELSKKLINFSASISDKAAWETNFATLSHTQLEENEKFIVEEFKDMYETYLLLYHHEHPMITGKYGENVTKATANARERLLTMILWEAYKLIENKSSDYETWIINVQDVIDVRASDEFIIRLTTNRIDGEGIKQLIKDAHEHLRELRKTISEDPQWHDNCNKVLARLSNAFKQNGSLAN